MQHKPSIPAATPERRSYATVTVRGYAAAWMELSPASVPACESSRRSLAHILGESPTGSAMCEPRPASGSHG